MHVDEGGYHFRYGIPGIRSKRNWPESDGIQGIPESNGIGTDSGGGTSSAMFNIAESDVFSPIDKKKKFF